MKVVSLNVAPPSTQCYGREEVKTGGAKTPVPSAVLHARGFEGDGHADLVTHGGPEKAVYVDPFDHHAHRSLGRRHQPGAFSDNLIVSGAVESGVCVGAAFERVERHPERISIADVDDVIFGRSEDLGLVERLASLPGFGADGRDLFAECLAREKSVS